MTTIKATNPKIISKKVVMHGAIIVAAVILLTAAASSEVLAQGIGAGSKNATTAATSPSQGNLSNASPFNITGSIPLRSTISGAIASKVKTTLSDAVLVAQKAVGSNTSATLALLRPLNGYLVYDIHVRNNANNTHYAVIVDPGNGKVLYKQTLPQSSFGGAGYSDGMFGKGRMGSFFGGHDGRFGFHGGMMMVPSSHPGAMGSMAPKQ
ncbi:MAG: PepSY domain-containing protein [Nitrososphaeraceae archaeon]